MVDFIGLWTMDDLWKEEETARQFGNRRARRKLVAWVPPAFGCAPTSHHSGSRSTTTPSAIWGMPLCPPDSRNHPPEDRAADNPKAIEERHFTKHLGFETEQNESRLKPASPAASADR
jgi:hypothetical protein